MADPVTVWTLIAGMTVVSLATRSIFIVPGERIRLGPGVERVLRFAPAAALMAIVVPDIAKGDNGLWLSIQNPRLVAGLAAFVVAAVTRNIMATIATGLAALWFLR